MKHLFFLFTCLLVFTPSMTANNVARVYVELWEQPSHPHIEFIKIEGVWYQLSVGADGFAAMPTNDDVDTLITAILSLPLGDVQYGQPATLDLNSLDDTATTVGATPVLWCAQLASNTGDFYALCVDEDNAGNLWASTSDSIAHLVGWFRVSNITLVQNAIAQLR